MTFSGRAENQNIKTILIFSFATRGHTFDISGHLVKKVSYRFLKDGIATKILGKVCKGGLFFFSCQKQHSYEVTLTCWQNSRSVDYMVYPAEHTEPRQIVRQTDTWRLLKILPYLTWEVINQDRACFKAMHSTLNSKLQVWEPKYLQRNSVIDIIAIKICRLIRSYLILFVQSSFPILTISLKIPLLHELLDQY